jgi:hypothetical protein
MTLGGYNLQTRKCMTKIIKNDSIGTVYATEEIFSKKDAIETLGESVRFVGIVGVFEGSNGVLMEFKLWAKDFDIEDYEE